jgi:hypothetical protein
VAIAAIANPKYLIRIEMPPYSSVIAPEWFLLEGRATLRGNFTAGGEQVFERLDQTGVVGCIGDRRVAMVGFFGFCH